MDGRVVMRMNGRHLADTRYKLAIKTSTGEESTRIPAWASYCVQVAPYTSPCALHLTS